MSAPHRLLLALALGGALIASGCGKKEAAGEATRGHGDHENHGDEHAHGHDESGESGVARFDADHGLELAPEAATAIGLATTTVERRSIAPRGEITATVFDAGPPARASALVPSDAVEALADDARVLAVHREIQNALGQIELVVAAPGTPAVGTTLTLELRGDARDMLSVPRAAVLRTATGVFVYVHRDDHWLRTPVTTGASDGEFVAIADGLAAGDVVAVSAVEHLWLTELRLTKGGGHSH